jgi:hypothetical protein
MKTFRNIYQTSVVAAASAIVFSSGTSAKADLTLTLTDATSKAEDGFVATVNDPNPGGMSGTLTSGELVGIYDFSVTGFGSVNSLWSTCISPLGVLDWNTHTYAEETFSAASPGYNPADWAVVGGQPVGIENAQYLWRLYSPTIIASGNAAQGAGLELAMWAALYNSTSYGHLGGNIFSVGTWAGGTGTGTANAWYNTYLAGLSSYNNAVDSSSGFVFEDAAMVPGDPNYKGTPTSGAGQELIYNTTPVPEPTTIVAGALLLLPFGASTLRAFRKNRVA